MDVERALVLGALGAADASGFEVAQRLRAWGVLRAEHGAMSEASVVATLHRLQAEGTVSAVWQETGGGRRRRYRWPSAAPRRARP